MGAKKQKKVHSKGYQAVNAFARTFPGAYEEFPWGHSAIKVHRKIFISMGETEDGFSMSVKLTDSNFEALLLPFTEPTHYGMGKHGWVTARFAPKAKPPLPLIKAWIEESYRAIAPKKRVAELDGAEPAKPAPARKKAAGSSARECEAAQKTTGKKAVSKKATTKKAAAKKVTAKKAPIRGTAAKMKPVRSKKAGRTTRKKK